MYFWRSGYIPSVIQNALFGSGQMHLEFEFEFGTYYPNRDGHGSEKTVHFEEAGGYTHAQTHPPKEVSSTWFLRLF